jgi:nucleotide-binding universal stress UspA family protein
MFKRIVVAVHDFRRSRAALDLVRNLATEGVTQVQVLHLREREIAGPTVYSREDRDQASFVADAAIFELRMDGISAGGNVRYAIVDRIAEAILREAEAFNADLIVLGRPRRGEFVTRLLGGVTMRVIRRSTCPVIVAPRRERKQLQAASANATPGRAS